ncbi:rhamnogalacturonidase [Jiulongibacter sp. NS-SX5]|uniref:rhamnogalacturonidase n=1 Tax=Jiulongibacter sp. NS-SX5 TaxID=3463854 RepID=UPI004059BF4B
MIRHSLLLALSFLIFGCTEKPSQDLFPDGTPISAWFKDYTKRNSEELGQTYLVTDYGVLKDSTLLQTEAIQAVIDSASADGGGVIVFPEGVYLSGALFFKPGTHLMVTKDAKLKGSDQIEHYPLLPSRIEGQNLDYYSALVNAYGVDGFTILGEGTIDGNGLAYWKAFWQRREENPQCTNLEVSRPRLVFIKDSKDVQVQDVSLQNSGFWSSHYYRCERVKVLDVSITSPHEPIKAPSTDAIDLDVCSDVLIKGCYMAVNDDAIALKGGKGPYADEDPNNGENTNIIIEDCEFGFCHSALTCGSESIHNKNIIFRNIEVNNAVRILWLKMRPDTPQHYEYITVDNVNGNSRSLLYIKPWTQFFDLKGRPDVPISYSDHITLKNMNIKCQTWYDMKITENDRLSDFTFENLNIESENIEFDASIIDGLQIKNVMVNGEEIEAPL